MASAIVRANITAFGGQISIRDAVCHGKSLQESAKLNALVQQALHGEEIPEGQSVIQITKNKIVTLNGQALVGNAAEKVHNAFQSYFSWDLATNSEHHAPVEKGCITKSADYVFRKKLYHAKASDAAQIVLFGFAIVALILHSPAAIGIAHGGFHWIQPVFGGLNILVGGVLLYQSYINFQKAQKIENKAQRNLAIATAAFSAVIAALGIVSILSFANITNQFVFKALLASCAALSFGFGAYNFGKAQKLRNRLNRLGLKKALKEEMEISNQEQIDLETRMNALDSKYKINTRLKELLTNNQMKMLAEETPEDKKQFILQLELEMLQKRKFEHLKSIIGDTLAQRAIDFMNGSARNDVALKKDILWELTKRQFAEGLRMLAPLLSVGAFSINTFTHISNRELIYNVMTLGSILSVFWLNYHPAWRNVPTEEVELGEALTAADYFIESMRKSQIVEVAEELDSDEEHSPRSPLLPHPSYLVTKRRVDLPIG